MLLRFTYTSDPSCSVTLIMFFWAVPSVLAGTKAVGRPCDSFDPSGSGS